MSSRWHYIGNANPAARPVAAFCLNDCLGFQELLNSLSECFTVSIAVEGTIQLRPVDRLSVPLDQFKDRDL
jgi:hypothetical protein